MSFPQILRPNVFRATSIVLSLVANAKVVNWKSFISVLEWRTDWQKSGTFVCSRAVLRGWRATTLGQWLLWNKFMIKRWISLLSSQSSLLLPNLPFRLSFVFVFFRIQMKLPLSPKTILKSQEQSWIKLVKTESTCDETSFNFNFLTVQLNQLGLSV